MIQNKIVVRYLDGRVSKGFTSNFMPNKDSFHLVPVDAPPGFKPIDVHIRELKAIFFVKDFVGDRHYNEKKTFELSQPVVGKKIQVVFRDGEKLVGTTQGYQAGRPGFFVFPADNKSNIDRFFVIAAAARSISFL
jgi:hypothetical protein